MKKKILIAAACIIVIAALSVTALGISGLLGKSPEKAQTSYKSLVENRMNFSVSSTEFFYTLNSEEDTFLINFTVTAAKTEADFYCVLNGITLNGAEFESIVYEPGENNGEYFNPHSLVMPVGADGKPQTLSWNVTASFRYNASGEPKAEPKLVIDYTGGLKKGYTDSHILTVPLKVTVLNRFMLTSVISDAQGYIDSGLYTQTSLTALQNAVNAAKKSLAAADTLTNEKISSHCTAISLAIQALVPKGA